MERISDQQRKKQIYCFFSLSAVMGMGIFAVHYIGMMAIIEPNALQFNMYYASLSFLIVLASSIIALKIFFKVEQNQTSIGSKVVSAAILGSAISSMHYLGMKGAFHGKHSQPEIIPDIHPFTLAIIVSIFIGGVLSIATYLVFLNLRTLKSERNLRIKMTESEERSRRLVEISPDPIVVYSEGEIVFANEATLKMMNETGNIDFMGKSIIDSIHPALKDSLRERIQHMEIGLKPTTKELRLITPDGSVIEVDITGVSIEFEGKSAIQFVLQDLTEQNKSSRALDENQQRYGSLFKNNPDGVFSMDADGRLRDINLSLERILGYSLEELTTMKFHVVIDPDHLDMISLHFIKALSGTPQIYETIIIRKNGVKVPLKMTYVPIVVDEKITGVYGIAKDISKEKEALELLEENEEKYRSLFDYNSDAVFEMNQTGFFTDVNKMSEKISGYSKEELLTLAFPALIANDLERVNAFFSTVISGCPVTFEQLIRNKNGDLVEVDISAVPKRKKGKVNGVFVIVQDVSEKKRIQKKINELAFTDQLTGLPNRHWFYQNLGELVSRTQKQQKMIALLLIDFDNFKEINDVLGHHGGDLFLKQVSVRIQASLMKKAVISRLGGDEFIILVEGGTEEDVRQLTEQILEDMKQPIFLLGQEIEITLSIGISMESICISDEETLIRQADMAMYSAKEKGKNNYQFFTEDLNEKVISKLQLEKALNNALKQEEFQLYYQPQIDLRTGSLVGIEALIRWNSPTGLVSPAEFIPLAEETGLILPIGEWVIKEACRQMEIWEDEGRSKMKVSVNVSARQFKDANFSLKVKKILEEAKIDPQYLEIEITESVMMNIEESSFLIQELKKLGVKIAIDDFGAGYSSLNVIKNIEIDTLKIDKSLLDEVLSNQRNLFILTAIIDVGKNLHAQVVVEGIEQEEQVIALREFDVVGQGYFYSRPLPADQLVRIWHTEQEGVSLERKKHL